MWEFVSIIIGYLLGSIPVAYIVAKLRKGIDIREVGVLNMGTGNVMREVGLWEGFLVAFADIGKGALAVYIAQTLGVSQYWVLAVGFVAVIGHNFPVFLQFKGGRGVAAVIGVMAVISPFTALIAVGAICIAWFIVRHLFSAILIAAPFFLIGSWFVEKSPAFTIFVAIIIVFIILRVQYRWSEWGKIWARTRRKA